MLTQEEKASILSELPNVKLSYETMIHKKVYDSNLILAIPQGIKCFVWFTVFNEKYVCLLIELDNNKIKSVKNIRLITTCFSKTLCYGTIMYGTLFYHMNNYFYSIEDLFLYKNKDFSKEDWLNKFNKIIYILKKDIKQVSYNKNFIVFGLPIFSYSNEKMEIQLKDVKYKINKIHYYKFNKNNSYFSLLFNEFNNTNAIAKDIKSKEFSNMKNYIVLEARADIQNDIYNLYCIDNKFCGIACIPDYKTSLMMNKLFRNIKENYDLDKLEESDDDDEFENSNIDKFVYLERAFKMICHYNRKFKGWVPVCLSKNKNLSTIDETINFIKKYSKQNSEKNK